MRPGLVNGPRPRRTKRDMLRTACDVKCPSCGGYFEPSSLRLHVRNTRGLAICGQCYHTYGPDGALEAQR
jgi:transcription elongation factor Elf1